MNTTALFVSASVQPGEQSLSRQLAGELISHLQQRGKIDAVIERDLSANDLPLLTADHVAAFYTPAAERDATQAALLSASDALLAELREANTLIIASPMYNFSVPAVLKAWIDLICRAGESFRYTPEGPVGLLDIDTAYLVVATGGVPVRSPVDFLVPYLEQIARFIGVRRIEVIAADKLNSQRELALAQARSQIKAL